MKNKKQQTIPNVKKIYPSQVPFVVSDMIYFVVFCVVPVDGSNVADL